MKELLEDKTLSEAIEELKNEINERKRAEEALMKALENTQKREREISALLEGSRAILEYRDFSNAARRIFDSCKKLIGAEAGYVALLSEDGKENEVLFLDSGGLPCSVDPSLPMPIRGLRGVAYNNLTTVYENDFPKSEWLKCMPKGHVRLENVLFAPLLIEGRAVGLLGLANKPGGFTGNDATLATAFGEYAAISLYNNWTLDKLEKSEERYHKVVQTANDSIISFDSSGDIISWNQGAEEIFGYSVEEAKGKSFTIVMPERLNRSVRAGIEEMAATGKSWLFDKNLELTGRRKNADEFPMELSLTTWKTREGVFFTAIVRDITERKRAMEAIGKLNESLELRSHELEAANRDLESFSYSVSHDLRVPLKTIEGYSKALLQDHTDSLDEGGRELLRSVSESAARMDLLITELLVFYRMGRKSPAFSEIDMEAAAGETFGELLIAQPPERDIRFELKKLPQARGDESMVRLVLTNLFSNAIKFTANREHAVIEAGFMSRADAGRKLPAGQNVYYVKDNGAGFDMAQAGKLFGVFQRLHRQDEFEGTGLGLATVKAIVTKHGGAVWAASRPGEGATFYFTLPERESEEQAEEVRKTGT